MAERIERELHLSPRQAGQVREIVTRRLGEVRAIMEENRPRMEVQFTLMKEEVAEVLDEDQEQEWRERFTRLLRYRGRSGGPYREAPKERHGRDRDDSGASGPERRGDAEQRGQREDARPRQPL